MTNRLTKYVVIGQSRYRINKTSNGKRITVHRHELNPRMTQIMGADHYEISGHFEGEYPTTGKYKVTLAEVVEMWAESDQPLYQ